MNTTMKKRKSAIDADSSVSDRGRTFILLDRSQTNTLITIASHKTLLIITN